MGRSNEDLKWLSHRYITIGYYALVKREDYNIKAGFTASDAKWYKINSIPDLIYDHNEILDYSIKHLRSRVRQAPIGFNLLPETFTMKELQGLYEAVYDREFAMNNFQKKILDLDVLERLEKKYTGAANKAPYLYRFKR